VTDTTPSRRHPAGAGAPGVRRTPGRSRKRAAGRSGPWGRRGPAREPRTAGRT